MKSHFIVATTSGGPPRGTRSCALDDRITVRQDHFHVTNAPDHPMRIGYQAHDFDLRSQRRAKPLLDGRAHREPQPAACARLEALHGGRRVVEAGHAPDLTP